MERQNEFCATLFLERLKFVKKIFYLKCKMDLNFCTALFHEKLKFVNALIGSSSKYFDIIKDLLLSLCLTFSLVSHFSDKS